MASNAARVSDRSQEIQAFLTANGWGSAQQTALAGDASNRRYVRLQNPSGDRAVLMDASADAGAPLIRFIDIASYLISRGLSAPRIVADDVQQGLLLLEDLGDTLFASEIASAPELEPTLYKAAVEQLLVFRDTCPAFLVQPQPDQLADFTDLAFDYYCPLMGAGADPNAVATATAAMAEALSAVHPTKPVFVHRDYHAENLIWLPKRAGVARVGVLDFQDAWAGHPAYDLMSLLQDARRDVSAPIAQMVMTHYVTRSGDSMDALEHACAVYGAQRHLRILGIFARLGSTGGRPGYLKLIPRTWRYLQSCLQHPKLHELGAGLNRILPPPRP